MEVKTALPTLLLITLQAGVAQAASKANEAGWNTRNWTARNWTASATSTERSGQPHLTQYRRALDELDALADPIRIVRGRLINGYSTALNDALHQLDTLSDYETQVPRATQPDISRREKHLLSAYLNNIDHAGLAQLLALHHLRYSLLRKPGGQAVGGEAVRHTILARYFLHRVQDLGHDRRWVETSLQATQTRLNELIESRAAHNDERANAAEDHSAHVFFRETFFDNNEGNRFIALRKLFDDFVKHPHNTLTNTYLTTANIWMGGEADYDDPTILYHFVLSGYFSVRARYLAEQREVLWRMNPGEHTRFRLATLIGGWTVPARRWLARLHGDDMSVQRLDEEHNQWLAINTAFTSVPVGLMLFEENDKFAEGFAAWEAGRQYCDQVSPTDLSCINWPRASFNILSFVLGEVDFFLKSGQLATAQSLLSLRHIPNEYFAESFAAWDIGRDAWLHREQNLEQIAELYQNDDPDDDPSHFLLKQHKWGPGTFICQVCHQRQSTQWPEGEVERVLSWADEIPPVGEDNWPVVSTTWYGASLAR